MANSSLDVVHAPIGDSASCARVTRRSVRIESKLITSYIESYVKRVVEVWSLAKAFVYHAFARVRSGTGYMTVQTFSFNERPLKKHRLSDAHVRLRRDYQSRIGHVSRVEVSSRPSTQSLGDRCPSRRCS